MKIIPALFLAFAAMACASSPPPAKVAEAPQVTADGVACANGAAAQTGTVTWSDALDADATTDATCSFCGGLKWEMEGAPTAATVVPLTLFTSNGNAEAVISLALSLDPIDHGRAMEEAVREVESDTVLASWTDDTATSAKWSVKRSTSDIGARYQLIVGKLPQMDLDGLANTLSVNWPVIAGDANGPERDTITVLETLRCRVQD